MKINKIFEQLKIGFNLNLKNSCTIIQQLHSKVTTRKKINKNTNSLEYFHLTSDKEQQPVNLLIPRNKTKFVGSDGQDIDRYKRGRDIRRHTSASQSSLVIYRIIILGFRFHHPIRGNLPGWYDDYFIRRIFLVTLSAEGGKGPKYLL